MQTSFKRHQRIVESKGSKIKPTNTKNDFKKIGSMAFENIFFVADRKHSIDFCTITKKVSNRLFQYIFRDKFRELRLDELINFNSFI